MNPVKFFSQPKTPGQKQYEALRAFYIDHVPGPEVIRRFGYTVASFNSLKQKFKSDGLTFLWLHREDRRDLESIAKRTTR